MSIQNFGKSGTIHIFHDDPVIAVTIFIDIVNRDEIRMLEVETVSNTSQLDFEIIAEELEGDFFAGGAFRQIDFTKSTLREGTNDRVPFQRLGFWGEGEFHF